MALAFQFQAAGFTPTKLSTEAAVTLEQDGNGFKISRSELCLRGEVLGLDEAQFKKLSSEAERGCRVSSSSTPRSPWTPSEFETPANDCRYSWRTIVHGIELRR